MQVLTTLSALVAVLMSGPASLLHVHAYEGHDHADHHHGPAAHAHGPKAARPHQHERPGETAAPRFESCDPGAHAVSVAVTCVSRAAYQAPPADLTVVAQTFAPVIAPRCVELCDVRAHSPPRLTDAPLRAPPMVHPA